LRYDLRKMRAHALLERDGNRYAYRLTDKGVKVALLFVLFHQRLYGPLANSLFHHPPPRRELPARQQTRKGHAQSRRLHTQGHSTLGSDVKCCTAPVNDLKRKYLTYLPKIQEKTSHFTCRFPIRRAPAQATLRALRRLHCQEEHWDRSEHSRLSGAFRRA